MWPMCDSLKLALSCWPLTSALCLSALQVGVARKHRWGASPFASTAQVSLAPTELLDQGSGLWPSMQLVSVTTVPYTLEMSLQTDVVWDLWCVAARGSVTVTLIRSSSCPFLVRISTICLIFYRWPWQTHPNQPLRWATSRVEPSRHASLCLAQTSLMHRGWANTAQLQWDMVQIHSSISTTSMFPAYSQAGVKLC